MSEDLINAVDFQSIERDEEGYGYIVRTYLKTGTVEFPYPDIGEVLSELRNRLGLPSTQGLEKQLEAQKQEWMRQKQNGGLPV